MNEATPKRLNVFERYLTLWVVLCMAAGVALGKLLPGFTDAVRRLEFGEGSQINVAIAVLIWLMVYPMMLKIDFSSIVAVRQRPRGILVTLFVNWLVKPFSMAAIGYLFFRVVFQPWIGAELANQYLAGSIILAAAPCTAMVFVWSYLTDGDPAYTLVQVSLNDLIMLVLFAPIVGFLVTGASTLTVPFDVLVLSVIVFIVIPLALGASSRVMLLRWKGKEWFEGKFASRVPSGDRSGAPCDAGDDLRLPGRQPDRPLPARRPDRDPAAHPGLLQLRAHLRPDEVAARPPRRRGPGSVDRRQQLLRARRGHRDRALRSGVGSGAGDRGRRPRRGTGDAVRLLLLQPDAALVPSRPGPRATPCPRARARRSQRRLRTWRSASEERSLAAAHAWAASAISASALVRCRVPSGWLGGE